MTALLLVLALLAASLVLYSSWASLRATRAWPPEGGFVALGGAFGGESLHYVDRGEARPGIAPVVLIHGASGNLRDMTQSLVEPLSRETRVIAIDRPGHGWSARTAHPDIADPAVQARAIHEVLSQLGVMRPVILGHSWGASVAAAYALEFPGGLSGLVALSGALYPWPGGVAWYHGVVRTPLAGWLFLRMLIVPGGKIFMEKGVQMNFHPDPRRSVCRFCSARTSFAQTARIRPASRRISRAKAGIMARFRRPPSSSPAMPTIPCRRSSIPMPFMARWRVPSLSS
mgnify:CR=1 FL=1